LSKIISIGTAVPAYRHVQLNILQFMQQVFAMSEQENRKLRYLYHHCGIDYRYSVIGDYSRPIHEWKFYPQTENLDPFPSLEQRMGWFNRYAAPLSVDAIRSCLDGKVSEQSITHLITVSCTGMSAPGLDLQIMELMDLPKTIYRTSINFMGCYAAIHALKLADAICKSEPGASVLLVCTELCTLHFQREATADNIASSLLFGDGSAAVLVTDGKEGRKGFAIEDFYSEVVTKGKKDMAWELSSSGFLMTLSGYIPELIEEDFDSLIGRALNKKGKSKSDIQHWCVHPGGKRILESIQKSLGLAADELKSSYEVLKQFGNMSSATILFVLKNMMEDIRHRKPVSREWTMAAAFGPGLTMETLLACYC
jgi:predicted naringenin-chalcone synthase